MTLPARCGRSTWASGARVREPPTCDCPWEQVSVTLPRVCGPARPAAPSRSPCLRHSPACVAQPPLGLARDVGELGGGELAAAPRAGPEGGAGVARPEQAAHARCAAR